MNLTLRRPCAELFRFGCLLVCFALVLSGLPVSPKYKAAKAQDSDVAILKRQLPPHYTLPKVSDLLDEGKELNRPTLPRPPLKPSTLCGYRDKACKTKQEKEKKVSQHVTPSNEPSNNIPAVPAHKSMVSLLDRFGRIASTALFAQSPLTFSPLLTEAGTFKSSNFNPGLVKAAGVAELKAMTASAMPLPPYQSDLVSAKLDPRYRIGQPGEDLFSGNYHFSLPLINLPGRAGHDLSLTLSYNSLVWIRYDSYPYQVVSYDYDYYPSLTPGFRLGFPEVAGPYLINSAQTSPVPCEIA